MADNTPLERALQEFLERDASDRREGNTLRALREDFEPRFDAIEREMKKIREAQTEGDDRVSRHGKRITRLEGGDQYDTGQHKAVDVEARLQAKELEELKENKKWLTRAIVGACLAVIGSLSAGYLLGHMKK